MRVYSNISMDVEFALKLIQVLRQLRARERQGILDRKVFLAISRDLEGCLEQVTVNLLGSCYKPKRSWIKRIWGSIFGLQTPAALEYIEDALNSLFGSKEVGD